MGKSRAIDWQSVRQRLDAVSDIISRGLSPEEEKGILKARARALACESGGEETFAEHIEILEFLLGYENYGIELAWVDETLPLKDLTPVPCTPPFVLGLINVRGRIVSVIDLRMFFDLPEKGLTDLNKVIIVRDGDMEFGILADALVGVRVLPLTDLQPSLPTLTGIREEFLRGVTGDRLALLDMGKIVADKRLTVREEVE